VKSCFASPREETGAIVEAGMAGKDDGAGFGEGFCAGLCAKAGKLGPAASKNASIAASRDLASGEAWRFAATTLKSFKEHRGMKHLAVPQRVFMMVFAPRDGVPTGRFDSHQLVQRAVNPCCYTDPVDVPRQEIANLGDQPGERPFRGQPSKFGSEGGHKVFVIGQTGNETGSLARASFLDNYMRRRLGCSRFDG
jgi:hypothetical protein